jgi:Uma2 family endonuclease
LIIEVLSPSKGNYDRGLKFELYREFPTLRDYLILHQKSIFAEHYSKQSDGSWVLREYRGQDARIPFPEIECELHLGSVYQDVIDQA